MIQKLATQKLRRKSSAHTCGAKNRRCESSGVTSPTERAEFYWAGKNGGYNKQALAFYRKHEQRQKKNTIGIGLEICF